MSELLKTTGRVSLPKFKFCYLKINRNFQIGRPERDPKFGTNGACPLGNFLPIKNVYNIEDNKMTFRARKDPNHIPNKKNKIIDRSCLPEPLSINGTLFW
jgi:hypothetical protein